MDGPPSFTSVMAKNTDQQQSQVTEPNHLEQDHYNPSMSKIRSYSSFEDRTAHAIVQPTATNYDDDSVQAVSIGAMAVLCRTESKIPDELNGTSYTNEQAPSMGCMVGDRGDSQTAGGYFSYNAPPSHSDVARHDESRTGESTGDQNLLEGNYEGMSLTGRDFARFYDQMMFQ